MPNRKISHRSLAIRIEALRRQHRELDNQVASTQARKPSDSPEVKHLIEELRQLRDAIHGAQTLMSRTRAHAPQPMI